jgi:hypothetical protein
VILCTGIAAAFLFDEVPNIAGRSIDNTMVKLY